MQSLYSGELKALFLATTCSKYRCSRDGCRLYRTQRRVTSLLTHDALTFQARMHGLLIHRWQSVKVERQAGDRTMENYLVVRARVGHILVFETVAR